MNNLTQLANEEGLQLKERTRTVNSRKALVLAESCKALVPDYFYPLHERLFEAYFIEGQNIGCEEVLKQLAKKCHISEPFVEQALSIEFVNGPANSVPPPFINLSSIRWCHWRTGCAYLCVWQTNPIGCTKSRAYVPSRTGAA